MNVKHIFVFTICVMLPNRLYSQRKDKHFQSKKRFYEKTVKLWTNVDNEDTPFETESDGSILISIMTDDSRRVFGLNLSLDGCRIEIKLAAPQSSIEEATLLYMAKTLGIPSSCMEIIDGLNNVGKRIRVYPGIITMEELKKKLLRQLADTRTH